MPIALLALLSPPVVREDSWADLALDALGWGVFLAGAAARFWSTLYVGGRKDDVLVTEGPYSLCRNPLYVGSLLLAFAAALFLKSIVFAAALLVTVLFYSRATVAMEEQYLLARFGRDYEGYCDRVPRFWPSLSHYRTPDRIQVHLYALRLEAARASRWVWIPVVSEILAHLRAHAWWAQPLRYF